MKSRRRFSMGILAAGFIALLAVIAACAQSNSEARIVRLSFVEGHVTVQRPDVQAWADAPVNTPLQEGSRLSSGRKSFAEIQFENGSTIRLGEHGLLDFAKLDLAPHGGKINHVELRQGYATFHLLPSRLGDSLEVDTPYGTLIAQDGTQFRVDLDQGLERLEVFSGTVKGQSNLGATTIKKDFLLIMQPGAMEPTIVSQGIIKDDWDQWVDEREAQVETPSSGPSLNAYTGDDAEAPYGWTDLLQYGTWSDVPGAGYGWTPTVVSNGWAPYSAGEWCWYPGWGYTWIGAEPWGWLPYHYGGWDFIPGKGWVWFPGSLRTWSPSQVTWFHGPNWVGWIPLSHRKESAIACGTHCGGGVVSTSTFQQGGRLTSNLMLRLNPTTGERVKDPGIIPTTAVKLTGPAVSSPAARSQGVRATPAHSPVAPGTPTTAKAWPTDLGSPSAIVYDSKQGSFVDGNPVKKPQGPPAKPAGATTTTTPSEEPGKVQPASVASRNPSGRPAQNQGLVQPNPARGVRGRPVQPPGSVQPNPARGVRGRPVQPPGSVQPNPARAASGRPVQPPGSVQPNPPVSTRPTSPVPVTSGFVPLRPVTPSSNTPLGSAGNSWAKQGPSGGRVGGGHAGGAAGKHP